MTAPRNLSKASTKKVRLTKCSDQIERRIIDQSAETIRELEIASGLCRKRITDITTENVKVGRWEVVFKKSGRRIVAAYRVKH